MINSVAGNSNNMQPYRSQAPANQPEKVDIDASHRPADIEIRTRNPEMDAHWDEVREEIGYLRHYARIKEIKSMAQQEMSSAIVERVQAGLRARDIHKEQGNVFGKIAFQKFLADRQTKVQIDAAPKYGVKIDVRIYPPEIKVDTNIKGGTNIL